MAAVYAVGADPETAEDDEAYADKCVARFLAERKLG